MANILSKPELRMQVLFNPAPDAEERLSRAVNVLVQQIDWEEALGVESKPAAIGPISNN